VTPQDPLAQLHPLRAPAAIGWWPPAPGWWALALAVLAAAALLAYLLWRRRQRNAYRRRAQSQLEALQLQYRASGDRLSYIEQVNALLKSVALLAYPRESVAAQHGESWRTFLNQCLPPADQFSPTFDDAAYRKNPPEIDPDQVHRSAQYWIWHHRVKA